MPEQQHEAKPERRSVRWRNLSEALKAEDYAEWVNTKIQDVFDPSFQLAESEAVPSGSH